MFVVGELYNRRKDIHQKFGGQQQGGICTPSQHPYVILFTGKEGSAYGYKDGWSQEGLFLYTGEGQTGDQQLIRGNKAILDHQSNGKELLLFQKEEKGFCRFIGQMSCIGYHEQSRPDRDGNTRRAIVFELVPVENIFSQKPEISIPDDLTLEEILKRASAQARVNAPARERKANYYQRSEYVKLYALKKANGKCQSCGQEAPFRNKKGEPYLEVHHLRRLSDGGPDDPRWVVALCPNCHSRIHNGEDGEDLNDILKRKNGTINAA